MARRQHAYFGVGLLNCPRAIKWSLALLYLVTALVVVGLYFPCRKFAEVKGRSKRWWVRFL